MSSGLRESDIRRNTDAKTFARGEEWLRNRAVAQIVRRGPIVQALVQDTAYAPYAVRLICDSDGIGEAVCTCPYDWGGWCSHIVAVALVCLRQPTRVQDRPEPAALLSSLTQGELQQVVLSLARRDLSWFEPLEAEIGHLQAARLAASTAQRPVAIDTAAIADRVHRAVQGTGRTRPSGGYRVVDTAARQVRAIVDLAHSALAAGDGETALTTVAAVIDAYRRDWVDLDDSTGDASALFYDLDELLAEALLGVVLTPQAREQWKEHIGRWQTQIMAQGAEAVFALALAAAKLDDSVAEERVLAAGAAPQLVDLYLNVLERRGDLERFLLLSDTAGRTSRHASKLLELERHAEAVAYARQHFAGTQEMLALAQALRNRGLHAEAIELGTAGLDLGEPHAELAIWLAPYAAEHSRPDLALRAASTAFFERPEPALFAAVREHAGSQWPQVREDLLVFLRDRDFGDDIAGPVALFLQEDLIDEALRLVDRARYVDEALIVQVAAAAATTHPQWVISQLRPRAEQIMEEGLAGRYAEAVAWLRLIRAACVAGRQAQRWEIYFQRLRERHSRKYKLMALLREIES